MTISVINAVAEFERDLLIERTHADLIRAKGQGKVLVCPVKLTAEQKRIVCERLGGGGFDLGVHPRTRCRWPYHSKSSGQRQRLLGKGPVIISAQSDSVREIRARISDADH